MDATSQDNPEKCGGIAMTLEKFGRVVVTHS
jgi:hypothetical protein